VRGATALSNVTCSGSPATVSLVTMMCLILNAEFQETGLAVDKAIVHPDVNNWHG